MQKLPEIFIEGNNQIKIVTKEDDKGILEILRKLNVSEFQKKMKQKMKSSGIPQKCI